jgi:tetratricopeptide (TPR) repeat protein
LKKQSPGVLLGDLGHFDDAIRSFDQALDSDPRDPLGWHNKGLVLAKLGREDEAIACFEMYRELAGDHPSQSMNLRPFR